MQCINLVSFTKKSKRELLSEYSNRTIFNLSLFDRFLSEERNTVGTLVLILSHQTSL